MERIVRFANMRGFMEHTRWIERVQMCAVWQSAVPPTVHAGGTHSARAPAVIHCSTVEMSGEDSGVPPFGIG